jgi:hypothetical protein
MGGPVPSPAEMFVQRQQDFSVVPQDGFNVVEEGRPGGVPEPEAVQPQTAQQRLAGRLTFATGLRMLGEASQSGSVQSQLGAVGTIFSGMAQMTGNAGKWAMPVAAVSSFVFMQGQKNAQVREARARQNFANAYGQALQAAGALYNA